MFDHLEFEQLNLNRLYQQLNNLKLPTLAITSVGMGEGKTTICYGLAKQALKNKQRVLLIDFNNQNPSITQQFIQDSFQGTEVQQWLPLATTIPNLFILPAPQNNQLIFQLNNKQTLAEIFSKLSNSFDKIIIDCPIINNPDLNSVETSLIASAASGTAIVVMSSKTVLMTLEQAIVQLQKEKPNLVGTIMNDQYYPGLLAELIRESYRFDKQFPKLMPKLRLFLQKQPILNLEI